MLEKQRKSRDMKADFLKTASQRRHMTKQRIEAEGKQLKIGQSWEDIQMSICLYGKFSEFELKMIAKTLRKIKRRHKERLYSMVFSSPDMTIGVAKTLIERIYNNSLEGNARKRGKEV